jgi:hypothetical protein
MTPSKSKMMAWKVIGPPDRRREKVPGHPGRSSIPRDR